MQPSRVESQVIGIVAGEPSGDLLGAAMIDAFRTRYPSRCRFVGIGGPAMTAAGVESLFPMQKLSVRGYIEVIKHYREITGIRQRLKKFFLETRPSLFVGIDAPDFNLSLERYLKLSGIPVIHYVSPSVWAWRKGRIAKIKQSVDELLTIFPFEEAVYRDTGVKATYVGHPLADALAAMPDRESVRSDFRITPRRPVFALLPGSRVSELEQLADLFIASAERIAEAVGDALFLVPLATRETREIFEAALYRRKGLNPVDFSLLFGHAHEAMAAADVVLVASGTATLEAALLGKPMVIAYRMPRVSWWIMNALRYQPWVGLPNILAKEFVVPEFLQDAATPDALASAVTELWDNPERRSAISARFAAMAESLRCGAAARAAAVLQRYLT